MNVTLYGQSDGEKRAQENLVCRQIVREIGNFGITQRQQVLLIYLLASELENVEHMKAITSVVRGLDAKMFLSGPCEPDRQISGGQDGTIDP